MELINRLKKLRKDGARRKLNTSRQIEKIEAAQAKKVWSRGTCSGIMTATVQCLRCGGKLDMQEIYCYDRSTWNTIGSLFLPKQMRHNIEGCQTASKQHL